MRIARFSNQSGRRLTVAVEPWATEFHVETGSDFAIHYLPQPDSPDGSSLEFRSADFVAF